MTHESPDFTHAVSQRVANRPNPKDWGEDELMTLPEAVSLMWPDGVITVSTLRTAIRDGLLPHVRVGRRMFVTKRGLADLGRPKREAEAQKKMLA